ncbi:hypothetical protein DV737_g2935, partial [Chaetothyriales sp. CBS 132003]
MLTSGSPSGLGRPNASKGKDLPEKQLLVLGATPEQQREFLEQVNADSARRPRYNDRRNHKKAPISNKYTVGYTYQDVLDADQEDTLARLNVYMLSNPSALFAPLLRPLLTPTTVGHTLIAILLDWSEPQRWARQLRQWIRLLRSVIRSLDDDVKVAMDDNMTAWKERRVGAEWQAQNAELKPKPKPSAIPPLGPGEWDEALGIPLSIVCMRSELIYTHEREADWRDDHFDSVVQWLRCVALKHGASLIYTSSSDSNSLRTLLHSSLSISSLLKRDIAKPNYLDRDKILVPPNWDSWGKIRPIHEGTDLEAISHAWSVEIQGQPEASPDFSLQGQPEASPASSVLSQPNAVAGSAPASAVALYEGSLPALQSSSAYNAAAHGGDEPVTVASTQDFLRSQLPILEALKADDEREASKAIGQKATSSPALLTVDGSNKANTSIAELTGPYRRNVNGIDFDAEEAIRRLRERDAAREASSRTYVCIQEIGRSTLSTIPTATMSIPSSTSPLANLDSTPTSTTSSSYKAFHDSNPPQAAQAPPIRHEAQAPRDFLTTHPPHLPTPPFIHVPGIANFRDCGGYECAPPPDADLTIGARYMVRRRVLFRCAHPTNLTPDGAGKMRDELAITDVFDLRSLPEIEKLAASATATPAKAGAENPLNSAVTAASFGRAQRQQGSANVRHDDGNLDTSQGFVVIPGISRTFTPVYAQEDYSPVALARKMHWYTTANSDGKDYSEGFVSAYRDIATYAARGGAYATNSYANSKRDGGVVFHCTAGKDRTGVLAAVILKLCGVPDHVIHWEYAITEPGLGDWRKVFIDRISRSGIGGGGAIPKTGQDQEQQDAGPGPGVVSRAEAARICGSRASNMRAWIETVLDGEFGGVDRYLTEMVGLSAHEVEGLRKGLVVEVAQEGDLVEPVPIAGWTVERGMDEDQ